MHFFSTIFALFLLPGIGFARNDSPGARPVRSVHSTKTSYPLPRGATSFVIRLRDHAQGRNFVFVNENAGTQGELSIAVSSHSLAADSPNWSPVEGRIRFRHKRVFTVSLVGVEANYVRLNFNIEVPRTDAGKTAGDRARRYKLARIASS